MSSRTRYSKAVALRRCRCSCSRSPVEPPQQDGNRGTDQPHRPRICPGPGQGSATIEPLVENGDALKHDHQSETEGEVWREAKNRTGVILSFSSRRRRAVLKTHLAVLFEGRFPTIKAGPAYSKIATGFNNVAASVRKSENAQFLWDFPPELDHG